MLWTSNRSLLCCDSLLYILWFVIVFWFWLKELEKNNWRMLYGLLQEIRHSLTISFVHWTIKILRWMYLASIMTFYRESSLHNSFYSFSNYTSSWECQPLSIRAMTKIKCFRIECIKQDTYTVPIECLIFALYFSFIWRGHQNVLGSALISIWKKVIFRK